MFSRYNVRPLCLACCRCSHLELLAGSINTMCGKQLKRFIYPPGGTLIMEAETVCWLSDCCSVTILSSPIATRHCHWPTALEISCSYHIWCVWESVRPTRSILVVKHLFWYTTYNTVIFFGFFWQRITFWFLSTVFDKIGMLTVKKRW